MKEKCAFLVVLCLLVGPIQGYTNESPRTDDPSQSLAVMKSASFKINCSYILTYVSVNGKKKMAFIVDNGIDQTTIDARLNEALAFEPSSEIKYNALNKKGKTAAIGNVPEMKVGDLEFTNPEVRSADMFRSLSKRLRVKVCGFVAYATIKDYLTTFDFKSKKVFFTSSTPEAVAAIEGCPDVIALPFGPGMFSGPNKHVFTVKIEINGKPVDAFVDLGFPGSIITSMNHADLDLNVSFNSNKTPVSLLGRAGYAYPTSAREVRIGDQVHKNVKVLYLDSKIKPEFTLLGVDFIKKFNVTLDYKNKKLYLVPVSSKFAKSYYKASK